MLSLNYIDIGILVLLVLISIKGIWQGFVRGGASFLGIGIGIFLASSEKLYKIVGGAFQNHIYDFQSKEIHALIGFLIILIVVWAGFLLLGEIVARFSRFSPSGVIDGIFGLIFGFCKAFLIISIIVFGVSQIEWLKDFSQKVKNESSVFSEMGEIGMMIMNLSPEKLNELTKDSASDMKDKAKDKANEIKNKAQEAIKEGVEGIANEIQSLQQ